MKGKMKRSSLVATIGLICFVSCESWPTFSAENWDSEWVPPFLRKPNPMHLRFLENKNVTCNDGSPAGYYIRKNQQSDKWIIFLEGGWYCLTPQRCQERMQLPTTKSMMSSRRWSNLTLVDGILSPDKQRNPTWWNANHVYVRYCSSDVWTGNSIVESGNKGFAFHGSQILDEVIKELSMEGLLSAKLLLFAGTSAGGTGVMFNLDRIGDALAKQGSKVKVVGIVDSGWFLDNGLTSSKDCGNSRGRCKRGDQIRSALRYWNARLPESCTKTKSTKEHYRCFFGNDLYPTLKRPIFIFHWQYDFAQIIADNEELLLNPIELRKAKYMSYVVKLGSKMRQSLRDSNVHAVFAPSCVAHTILTKKTWLDITINGVNLDQAISCWLMTEYRKSVGSAKNISISIPKCKQHLIDMCRNSYSGFTFARSLKLAPHPHCNQQCPPFENPLTGNKLDLRGLLNLQKKKDPLRPPVDLASENLRIINRLIKDFNQKYNSKK